MTRTIRNTLLIGIPIAIFVIFWAWMDAHFTAAVHRPPQAELLLPAQPAPCAEIVGLPHSCSTDAYVEIHAALRAMTPHCRREGQGASAWAELNREQPSGYEVIARCEGRVS
jgi:hypothetical protein